MFAALRSFRSFRTRRRDPEACLHSDWTAVRLDKYLLLSKPVPDLRTQARRRLLLFSELSWAEVVALPDARLFDLVARLDFARALPSEMARPTAFTHNGEAFTLPPSLGQAQLVQYILIETRLLKVPEKLEALQQGHLEALPELLAWLAVSETQGYDTRRHPELTQSLASVPLLLAVAVWRYLCTDLQALYERFPLVFQQTITAGIETEGERAYRERYPWEGLIAELAAYEHCGFDPNRRQQLMTTEVNAIFQEIERRKYRWQAEQARLEFQRQQARRRSPA